LTQRQLAVLDPSQINREQKFDQPVRTYIDDRAGGYRVLGRFFGENGRARLMSERRSSTRSKDDRRMFANRSYPALFSVFATLCLRKHLNTEEKNYHLSSAPQVATMVSIINSSNFAAEININNLGWRINVMIKHFAAALAAGACLVSANTAFAAVASAVLNVSANISPSCNVDPEGGQMNFGELDMQGTTRASTNVRVTCNVPDDFRPTMILRSSNSQNASFRMAGSQAGSPPIDYYVKVGGNGQGGYFVMSGQSFEMPTNGGSSIRNQYLTVEATVDGDMLLNSVYGSYNDQITVEVSY